MSLEVSHESNHEILNEPVDDVIITAEKIKGPKIKKEGKLTQEGISTDEIQTDGISLLDQLRDLIEKSAECGPKDNTENLSNVRSDKKNKCLTSSTLQDIHLSQNSQSPKSNEHQFAYSLARKQHSFNDEKGLGSKVDDNNNECETNNYQAQKLGYNHKQNVEETDPVQNNTCYYQEEPAEERLEPPITSKEDQCFNQKIQGYHCYYPPTGVVYGGGYPVYHQSVVLPWNGAVHTRPYPLPMSCYSDSKSMYPGLDTLGGTTSLSAAEYRKWFKRHMQPLTEKKMYRQLRKKSSIKSAVLEDNYYSAQNVMRRLRKLSSY